jgi:hypothetical protein
MDPIEVWNECVKVAKGKTGEECSYQIIKGSVLRKAQRAYLTIMLGK